MLRKSAPSSVWLALGGCFALAFSAVATGEPQATTQLAVAANPSKYLGEVCSELQAQWPKNRTINIVCHGHSVPAGYGKTPAVHMMDAYPHLLQSEICEAYPSAVVNVIVTAIGGEQSESGEQRFQKDVLALRPDVVTIDYALNDRRIGLARAKAAWVSMIHQSQDAGVKLILLTPTPDMSAKLDDPHDPLNQHAEQIRELAAEYHLGLVDSLAAFQSQIRAGAKLNDLMAQSNHPNRLGHQLVAAELIKWFQATR